MTKRRVKRLRGTLSTWCWIGSVEVTQFISYREWSLSDPVHDIHPVI